ncbi:hypothetical protein HOLleu_09006 [Holothuria leucospilota]|uniref:Uncharacterized protein n=1 Tax=Holothuria leucospilota TaxID=206669 RepID=A0A9Q1CJU7_HOLLE|nr:hypothetical protein HOLleu_09006 [Holothuria leucospilota]
MVFGIYPRETCTDYNIYKILLQGLFHVHTSETILLLYSVNVTGNQFHLIHSLKFSPNILCNEKWISFLHFQSS